MLVEKHILTSDDEREDADVIAALDYEWGDLHMRPIEDWILNASDEAAIDEGCVFHYPSAFAPLNWWARYLRLYEGEWAGDPFVAVGWQIKNTMRTYGWLRWSSKWNRYVRRHKRVFTIIAKKNGKSPTLAADALYLGCGDGENGNNVYLGAKDGTQARRTSGKHMIAMCEESPELMTECKINMTHMKITHSPTRSDMFPISSGDVRSQKSLEGLNGSLIVDEIHVVDERFMDRVDRCGISRAESLQIERSTAGEGLGYGRRAYEYACKVRDGEIIDTSIMVDIYEAPQDLEPAELDKDPVKYGKMANPMWGITIDPSEYLADYQRSKVSPSKLGKFMMYRLNKWQDSADPWLSGLAWARSSSEYDVSDLEGRCGGLGLDFARVGDLCAAAFVVSGDKELVTIYETDEEGCEVEKEVELVLPHLWPMFWIPRHTTDEELHLVDWDRFDAAGAVRFTKGANVDYDEDVLPELTRITKAIKTKIILADPIFSGEVGQKLSKATKARYEDFPQQFKHYAIPSADFQERVIASTLRHPDNPCLNWQIGHVMVKEVEGQMKPIKDDKERHLRIDGVQASIMGLAAWKVAFTKKKSVYNNRGFLAIGESGQMTEV